MAEHGDRETARQNEILRTVVGSGVHGIAIEGTDDHDEMGVFIEPRDRVYGTLAPLDTYVWRTQPEGARSGPGDTDLVMYSLRHYVRLAAKGNPTALLPLWAPRDAVLHTTPAGERLRNLREAFMSQEAAKRFLGYMDAQHQRMLGHGKRNRVPNRPELIERYGYDVKYAAHALRLAYQGYEVTLTGRLTLPMADDPRERVLAVKRGEWAQQRVSDLIVELTACIESVLRSSACPLPERPDWERINRVMLGMHEQHWRLGRRFAVGGVLDSGGIHVNVVDPRPPSGPSMAQRIMHERLRRRRG